MAKPKVFIGSSGKNVGVANAISIGLEDSATATVWDNDFFGLNDQYLQRLLASASGYDFAVMVWAPDDVTDSKGLSQASPRDNVIFECGLFMGMLGKDHVFIVQDSEVDTKTPSDFDGMVLASYDGARIEDEPQSAVLKACVEIKRAISINSLKRMAGQWLQVYTEAGDFKPVTKVNDIDVITFADAVSFVRSDVSNNDLIFEARGTFVNNRIRGEWRDGFDNRGAFLLFLNPSHDVMYGYSASYGSDGGPVFRAWVLAQKTANAEATSERLEWGRTTLKQRTVDFPLKEMTTGS